MKKVVILALVAFGAAFVSCSKPTKTIENLKSAITAEVNASARYTAFAQRAAQDSLPKIASMFAGMAQSEAVHAQIMMTELEKLGETFTPVVDSIKADSTLANLYITKNGEEYEVDVMYSDFAQTATEEGAIQAAKLFETTMKIEDKHAGFTIKAIQGIESGAMEMYLPLAWAVCPVCGDTYVAGIEVAKCQLCGTASDKFIEFDYIQFSKK